MSNNKDYNWQQDLIDSVNSLQRKLEDAHDRIGINAKIKSAYDDAIAKVTDARQAVHRLTGVFNAEL